MWQSLARVNHVLTRSLMAINREPFKITTRFPPPFNHRGGRGERVHKLYPTRQDEAPVLDGDRRFRDRFLRRTVLEDLISAKFRGK